jgi:hypothetical protein
MWALHWRARADGHRASDVAAAPAPAPAPDARGLKRALDIGDLGDVADALCALATPPARDLDEVQARLADPAQQAAVAQLQRARWGDGDVPAARTAMRAAFQSGPRWLSIAKREAPLLAPLYPQRD